jgi:hypothetical protein
MIETRWGNEVRPVQDNRRVVGDAPPLAPSIRRGQGSIVPSSPWATTAPPWGRRAKQFLPATHVQEAKTEIFEPHEVVDALDGGHRSDVGRAEPPVANEVQQFPRLGHRPLE